MKKYYPKLLSIFLLSILCKISSGQDSLGWQQLSQITENVRDLNGLHFFNKDSGWVCGSYRPSSTFQFAASTLNGGLNWEQHAEIGTLRTLYDITFVNDSIGYCLNGWILKTTNFGQNWDIVFNDYGADLTRRIKFFNAQYGWAVGMDSTIVKTNDGGETWEYVFVDSLALSTIFDITVVDSNIVVINSQNSVHKTIDGGKNWKRIYHTDDIFFSFYTVEFTSYQKGWIGGSFRTILFSKDGGNNWQDQSPETNSDAIRDMDALDSLTAIAVTSAGAILRTNDGGQNWLEQVPKDVFSFLTTVQMIDSLSAWAVGIDGTIVKTTNGGVTWLSEATGTEIPKNYKLYPAYPNPFNPVTKIKFELPHNVFVKVAVFNILGQHVETLYEGQLNAGTHELVFNASGLASGVYIYKLTAGTSSGPGNVYEQNRKMILVK